MDVNDFRTIVTLLSLIAFIAIVVWAWSRRNHSAFDEAAMLPFADESGSPHSPTATEGVSE